MKRIDIDRIFGNLVAEKIADGYVINTNTMGGIQGELSKVDLRKGDDFLRIHMEHHVGISDYSTYYAIIIGRSVKPVKYGNDHEIVWTDDLEEVSRYVFWQIGDNWFTGIEEYAKECFGKRRARERYRWNHVDPLEIGEVNLPVSSHKVVLGKLRGLPRCKSVKLSDIKRVWKSRKGDCVEWMVTYRDWNVAMIGLVDIA